MGKADLHVHSIYSKDGTATIPEILFDAANVKKLDVIAITDHDEIQGALEAKRLAHHYNIEVIPGCEISTAEGHLLTYFIEEPIPAGFPLIETIHLVAQQGGHLCSRASQCPRHSQHLHSLHRKSTPRPHRKTNHGCHRRHQRHHDLSKIQPQRALSCLQI